MWYHGPEAVIIDSINFENFRSFVDEVGIQVRPLTLLFGYNSAGKSALLRGLPLVAASLRTQDRAPLALACAAARDASFSDFLPHPALSASRKMCINLGFRNDIKGRLEKGRMIWRVTDLPELKQQVVEEFEVIASDIDLKAVWHPAVSSSTNLANQYTFTQGKIKSEVNISFRGLVPEFPEVSEPCAKLAVGTLKKLFSELSSEKNDVQWLGTVRSTPTRFLPWKSTVPTMLKSDGTGASDILAYDDLAKGPILKEVSEWYEKHLGWQLTVSPLADQYRLMMKPAANSPVEVYLSDVGEGLVQVLPVLVACARLRGSSANAPQILAVEEPESHLHPRLHAALTEKFCELASLKKAPQIILETHSENILLRVQLAVVEGELPPDNVIVYWVRQTPDGRSSVDQVEFDSLGRPKGNWPPGVFAEDIEQARELLALHNRRSQS